MKNPTTLIDFGVADEVLTPTDDVNIHEDCAGNYDLNRKILETLTTQLAAMNDSACPHDMILHGATSKFGTPLLTYDDGFGPLYVYRDAGGTTAVIRALSWEDALQIVDDEIFNPISIDELHDAYGYWIHTDVDYAGGKVCQAVFEVYPSDALHIGYFDTLEQARTACLKDAEHHGRDLVEGYRYQSNATGTGVVSFDLNGEQLELLTPQLAKDLGLVLDIRDDDDDDPTWWTV